MKRTAYFTHPDSLRHEMGRGHPECPERLDAIEDQLLATGVLDALERRDAPLAALAPRGRPGAGHLNQSDRDRDGIADDDVGQRPSETANWPAGRRRPIHRHSPQGGCT